MNPQEQINGESEFRQDPADTIVPKWLKKVQSGTLTKSQEKALSREKREEQKAIREAKKKALAEEKRKKKEAEQTKKKAEQVNVVAEWTESVLAGKQGKWAAEYDRSLSIVYKWNGNFWNEVFKPEGEAIVAEWLAKHHPKRQSPTVVRQAHDFAEMRLRSYCPLPKQTKRCVIPLTGAYCEVKEDGSIIMMDPDPSLGMKYAVNCKVAHRGAYTPKPVPTDSRFYKFLSTVQPNEQERALVQEQCAMSLIPGRKNNCAWWFGDGRNGKGTVAELLSRFHYKRGNFNLHKLDDEFHLEPGYGASLWVCDEVEKGKWAESAFKTFISGNGMTVGRKHVSNVANYHNEGYAIIMSNPKPFYTDTSHGVAERIVAVEWTVQVPEKERQKMLDEIIFEEEGEIVLDWLLEGVQRIRRRGGNLMPLSERPEAVRALRAELDLENDVVGAWLADTGASVSAQHTHTKQEIYEAFSTWAKQDGKPVLEPVVFWRNFWGRKEMRQNRSVIEFQSNGQRKMRFTLGLAEELED